MSARRTIDLARYDHQVEHVLWRCEKCGKWSHAQRRPLHHQHFAHIPTDHGEKVEVTYCGPFRRFVALEEDADRPGPHRVSSSTRTGRPLTGVRQVHGWSSDL